MHTYALVQFSVWILQYETLELLFIVSHSPFRSKTPGRRAVLWVFVYFVAIFACPGAKKPCYRK